MQRALFIKSLSMFIRVYHHFYELPNTAHYTTLHTLCDTPHCTTPHYTTPHNYYTQHYTLQYTTLYTTLQYIYIQVSRVEQIVEGGFVRDGGLQVTVVLLLLSLFCNVVDCVLVVCSVITVSSRSEVKQALAHCARSFLMVLLNNLATQPILSAPFLLSHITPPSLLQPSPLPPSLTTTLSLT